MSIHMSAHMSTHMSVNVSVHMSVHVSVHMSAHMSVHMSVHMSIHVSVHMSVHMPVNVSVHMSVHMAVRMPVYADMCTCTITHIYLSAHTLHVSINHLSPPHMSIHMPHATYTRRLACTRLHAILTEYTASSAYQTSRSVGTKECWPQGARWLVTLPGMHSPDMTPRNLPSLWQQAHAAKHAHSHP